MLALNKNKRMRKMRQKKQNGFTPTPNLKSCGVSSQSERGFTLIEMVAGMAIFVVLVVGVLSAFLALSRAVKSAREKTVLATLASNYLEVVRNVPYADVGTVNGNPKGKLADFNNAITAKIEGFTYQIYYEVTNIDDSADGLIGGTPNDPAPADYRQVKMSVVNTATGQVTKFLTNVSPKGLEGTQNAGAIKVQVFNFSGQRIQDADIHIQYPTSTPAVVLDRKSDANGEWIEVDLPAAPNNYLLVVNKPRY